MRIVSAVFSICLATATASRAEDAASPETIALAKSFAKICFLELPNFESVILRAKIEGWKQVDGPEREPILHRDSKPTTSSWLTKGVDDLEILVTVARRVESGQFWTCAVENPNVSTKGLVPTLVNLLTLPDATPETPDNRDPAQQVLKWQIRYGQQLVYVALMTGPAGKPGAILNAIQRRGAPD